MYTIKIGINDWKISNTYRYVNKSINEECQNLLFQLYFVGMQHTVLYGAEPRGLPLDEKIMPQYFNELGYNEITKYSFYF